MARLRSNQRSRQVTQPPPAHRETPPPPTRQETPSLPPPPPPRQDRSTIHAAFLAANVTSVFDNSNASSLVLETAACYCRKVVSTWDVQPFEVVDGSFAPESYSKGLLQELAKLAGTGIELEEARQRLEETIGKRADARVNGQYRKGCREERQLTPGDVRSVIQAYSGIDDNNDNKAGYLSSLSLLHLMHS